MRTKTGFKVAAVVAAMGFVVACDGGGAGGGTAGGGDGGGAGASINGEGLTGGAGGGSASGYAEGTNIALPLQPAQITWWHNGTEEPQLAYWEQLAREFEALHPGVTVTVTPTANADLRANAVFNAVDSGNPPDLFQSWGGGQLTEWVNEGITRDLTDVLAPTISGLSSSAVANWAVNGQSYGLPYAVGPAGFWVNLNLLNDAGLVTGATMDDTGNVVGGTVAWPTDLDGLYAMWDTLRAHNITPVAVGGGSGWAGPFWYYALVSQMCSPAAVNAAITARDFSDPCWAEAGTALKHIVGTGAFASDWGTTEAQGGADSSAGQVVLGQAAMELQGPWAGSVMSSIYQAQHSANIAAPGFLAWYPFPSVSGGAANSILAGGDGFSVLDPALGSGARSDAAAALLAFILSEHAQSEGLNFNSHGANVVALPGIPTNQAAAAQIADPVLAKQAEALAAAPAQTPWLDVYLGSNIGTALNNSVNSLMRGQIGADTVVQQLKTAAGAIG